MFGGWQVNQVYKNMLLKKKTIFLFNLLMDYMKSSSTDDHSSK